MLKRIVWVGAGVVLGVIAASKAEAYVKANTPQKAREFVLGPDQEHVAERTLASLTSQFRAVKDSREAELNKRYIDRSRSQGR
ncbi:hypothetical protein BACT_0627 [Bifidobacterium actinocoloniiforme DSM 22766]|uniref:Uncharacterized protein n=1 Tax=Bifidobacterium actinocoloniiforme DSM 22766 TaxID=1437605 RepID=A0A086Z076_9BIFI|nr:hypothetical protein [Bifidobacterium actinocoloniiforme]AKV55184.1 hypothetical protein AB656_01745 [Bifidobacterium actinocoloniiforme DSM 22766]KFI39926.1 hypothetical protein BACT_0627 [Bifidobacterium actinocoloniiforme DSM 22766]